MTRSLRATPPGTSTDRLDRRNTGPACLPPGFGPSWSPETMPDASDAQRTAPDDSNPEFDRLLTEAEGILDVDRRREVMAKLERLMQEEGPIVQPLWIALATFMDKRVVGFRMHSTRYIFGNELAIQS